MNVGILTNTYPPNLNGVSVSVQSLEKELTKLGLGVFVATPKVDGFDYPKNVFPIRSAEIPEKISPDLKLPYLYVSNVKKFFLENKVDIVHTHDTMFGGAEGSLIGIQLDVPTIHTFHTMVEDYNYFHFPGYKNVIGNLLKEICNQYDHVIAPSKKIYQYLLQKGVTTPLSNILNIPNLEALNTKFDINLEKEIIAKFKLKKEDFIFITFCRLASEKGLDLGIEVLSPILKKIPNIKYLIAGWGPQAEELKKKVEKLGLTNQILFFGKYKREQLPTLAKLSKVFLFTSKTENLPTNIMEAMYLGLPLVSIDDSSVDYLLEDGVNGFKRGFEDLKKACQVLIDNPDLQIKMSQKAIQKAKSIKPQKIATEHLDLYQQVIDFYQTVPKVQRLSLTEQTDRIYKLLSNSFVSTRKAYNKLLESFNLK